MICHKTTESFTQWSWLWREKPCVQSWCIKTSIQQVAPSCLAQNLPRHWEISGSQWLYCTIPCPVCVCLCACVCACAYRWICASILSSPSPWRPPYQGDVWLWQPHMLIGRERGNRWLVELSAVISAGCIFVTRTQTHTFKTRTHTHWLVCAINLYAYKLQQGTNKRYLQSTHTLRFETRCGVLGALTLPMRTGGTSTELQGRCYDN